MKRTRVFYSDNGSLTDISDDLNNYRVDEKTIPDFVASEDHFYIGNIAPFNHFYLVMGATKNTITSAMTIEYWDGNAWASLAELVDKTNGLKNDGLISWVPDRDNFWSQDDTEDMLAPLNTLKIYDLYWVRIAFANDLDPNIILSWLGQKFCESDDIYSEYEDLSRSNVLDSYKSGKTNWEEEIVRASEIIVKDLSINQMIFSKSQILDIGEMKLVCISKTAELIYKNFGDDYEDQRLLSRQDYKSRLNGAAQSIDQNNDGRLDEGEMMKQSGWLKR